MAQLAILLLGPFQVTLDGQPVAFATDKVRALLAYLAVESERPHPRESLAGLLWPDYAETSARRSLSQALSSLRGALGDRSAGDRAKGDLGPGDYTPPSYVSTMGDMLQFNRQSSHLLDVAALDQDPQALRDLPPAEAIGRLQEAVALYRGPFLEGFSLGDSAPFEEWATLKREEYLRRVLAALHRLVELHEQEGNHEDAQRWARRQVELAPLDEGAHRQLMSALALGGQRNAALAQYEACRRLLADELGVEPAAETTALYHSIREGSLKDARESSGRAQPGARATAESERETAGPGAVATAQTAPSPPAAEAVLPLLHQLPPAPADFVGRGRELREFLEAVQQQGARTIAVRGLGGMGKTSLALRLAERLTDQYPDAQLYIDMHGMDSQSLAPVEAMAQVIHAYHPLAQLPQDEAALGALYRSVLQGQRALILLDNVRDRAQVEPLLPPASCLLLLTTRWRFALPGLRGLDLEAQPPDQAVEMLRAIAPRLGQGRRKSWRGPAEGCRWRCAWRAAR